ncbi:hypothetical protein KVT40_001956 [Elsinoe batatas]|uniref:Uncharacterized protein n=1 Tax=Elsinoe batatas TaxID=2601811 RepID=A0A8K0L6Y0_9PEZI|nr:hypothetical protein KVT40_001956 [Elsinoe batatas]
MQERIDRLEEGLRNANSQNNTLAGRVTERENELNKQKSQVNALVKWKNGPLDNDGDLQTQHNAAPSTLRRRISSSSSESFGLENKDEEIARREAILERSIRFTQSMKRRRGMNWNKDEWDEDEEGEGKGTENPMDGENEEDGEGEVTKDPMDM